MRIQLFSALLAFLATADSMGSAPIDFTFGIASGVLYSPLRGSELRDGLEITLPFPDYVANKSYTAQIVMPGSGERNEAFAAIAGDRRLGFGSALTGEDGAMEVGVSNDIRDVSYWAAISRSYGIIKNNTERDLDFHFYYEIEPGELAIRGIRSDHTARARVEASIDYSLLTPDGGSWDESTGNLLRYYAGIEFDSSLVRSPNAAVTLKHRDDFSLVYGTGPLKGDFRLPTIPAYGQLTYYYDLFAILNVQRFEIGGNARIGDPTELTGGGRTQLVQISDTSETPEPATLVLVAAGLFGGIAIRRKQRR